MDNSQKVCDMLLARFQRIVALPQKRAANVVRYLGTTKDQSPQDEDQKIVSLTQSVSISLPHGATVLPAGTKLELLSRDKSEVRIRYMGGEYAIPISVTDLR
jgi:hypothetical protein